MIKDLMLKGTMLSALFPAFSLHAQFTDRYWTFGDSAAISFANINNPVSGISSSIKRGSCASVSDSAGNLLFYAIIGNYSGPMSNYATEVYDKNNNIMQNGDTIIGVDWYQTITIVPKSYVSNTYYLFTVMNLLGAPAQALFYSIIDLTQNNNLGAVIQKNINIYNDTLDWYVAAIKHGNGRDWWIITHKTCCYNPGEADRFFKFLVTPDSVYGPYMQAIGTKSNGINSYASSKDGKKFLLVSVTGLIELFDFDRCTGMFTGVTTIKPQNPNPAITADRHFGCSFSQSGRYIYVSNQDNAVPSNPYPYVLKQYDLQAPNILASEQIIFSDTIPSSGGVHKLGPDGKIYISMWFQNWSPPYPDTLHNVYTDNLCVINSPDSAGLACNYQPFSFYLGGRRSYLALPNNPNYELGPDTGSVCDTLGLGEAELAVAGWQLAVYPNPVNDKEQIVFEYVLPKNKQGQLEIFDVKGKKVYSITLPPWSTVHRMRHSFNAGLYFAKITGGNNTQGKKFVVSD